MSEPIYLYRAILSKPLAIGTTDHPGELPAGFSIGRRSGYLSRSSATDHAKGYERKWGAETEVIRSEPIVFLTEREKEAKRADELEAEAKRIRAGIETESSLFPDPFDVTTIAGSVRVWTANPLQYLTADEAREVARLLRVAAGALDVEDQ